MDLVLPYVISLYIRLNHQRYVTINHKIHIELQIYSNECIFNDCCRDIVFITNEFLFSIVKRNEMLREF